MKLTYYTLAPSPHITALMNTLHAHPDVQLRVVYEQKWLNDRRWGLHTGQAPHHCLQSFDLGGHAQLLAPELVSELSAHPPEVAIVNTSYVSINTYLLIFLLRQQGIPFIFWAERPSRLSRPAVKTARVPFLRWILNRAIGFVGSTEATVDFYRHVAGYCGPGTYVPYHRSLEPFLQLLDRTETPQSPRFLLLGTLSHGKGIDTILRALRHLSTPIVLDVVGRGPYGEELRRLAAATSCHHSIHFIDEVPYDRVPDVMAQADVLLFPSRHDGFGMVAMEALAAGVPVMASEAVMAAHQYIDHGRNGWVLPVDDEDAWAKQIGRLAADPEQLMSMRAAARDTIKTRYNVDADVERLLSFIARCTGRMVGGRSTSPHPASVSRKEVETE